MIQVRGLHADGQPYRWWPAVIERCSTAEIVLVWPAGIRFEAPTVEGRKLMRLACRMLLWPERPYTLVEQYDSDGALVELAMDIVSGAALRDGVCVYTDHELDVVKRPGQAAFVEDEDEFQEAIALYGYSPKFQRACFRVVREAILLIEQWEPWGLPEEALLARIQPQREEEA